VWRAFGRNLKVQDLLAEPVITRSNWGGIRAYLEHPIFSRMNAPKPK